MSYILDALRKADAERVRGALPDLHTQPVQQASNVAAPRPFWRLGSAAALAGVLAIAVAALLGSLLTSRHADRPVAVAATPALPVPQVSMAAALPPLPPLPALPAAPAVPAPLAVPIAPIASVSRDAKAPAAALPALLPAPTPAPSAAGLAEPRLYALSELPEPIRRDLPVLTVGGAMHSDNPAQRMLILNGQVFHERDVIAPNLTLVQVQLKSALLEFRGYRYRITY